MWFVIRTEGAGACVPLATRALPLLDLRKAGHDTGHGQGRAGRGKERQGKAKQSRELDNAGLGSYLGTTVQY